MWKFTECSGECEDCLIHYMGGCLAGHGDDDFIPMTEEQKKKYKNQYR